jgi:sortase A
MRSLTQSSHGGYRWLRALERTLLLTAAVCLSWYGWRMLEIRHEQAKATAEVQQAIESAAPATAEPGREVAPYLVPATGDVIGQLVIPRLSLTAPVKAGDDDSVLDYSVAYLPDTPLPWMAGNSAFAAHRDRLFRPLEHIRQGDAIELSTTHGTLHYRVLKTLIVEPKDVWVLDSIPNVNLTLITCYPFYYVGHAPRRFIVQAGKL